MSDGPGLLAPDFLARLGRMRLPLRRASGGAPSGGRTTRRLGGVLEFVAHRAYAPGDDPRRVDWNAYARLGRLAVKEFAREEVPRLRVLLDASASMGAEGRAKWDRAREVAAALAALAVFAGGTAEAAEARKGGCRTLAEAGSEGAIPGLLRALAALEPGGPGDLASSLRGPRRGPEAVALVSDLLDPADPRAALAAPPGAGEPIVVQLLAAGEARPGGDGAIELADSETGERLPCLADEALQARYAEALTAHRERWRRAVVAAGGRFVAADDSEPVEAIVGRVVRPPVVR
ncbi:MAG: DUF58 domain-containing protein [Planctomycetales bacterium]|nr:DUF58 domain-containing protein [Planctomycetales bacterium]